MFEKLIFTWLVFAIPMYIYGIVEITYLKINIRWLLLGVWFMILFFIVFYNIWG